MVHLIDEDLTLDKIRAFLKYIPLVTGALVNAETGQLILIVLLIKNTVYN